jgi:hypothetical protein
MSEEAAVLGSFLGEARRMRQLTIEPKAIISSHMGARCSNTNESGTARMMPAMMTPGYTGVANSHRWRNQKLMNVA